MNRIILTFLLLLLAICCQNPEPDKTTKLGKPMPAFNILLPDSSSWINTSSIPEGKKTAIFLFSPHCPYCRTQLSEIIEDMDQLKDVQFYMVTSFPFKDMKMFYEEYKLNKYKNIITGYDSASFAPNYFEVLGVPYIAIYDKHKKLSKAYTGKIFTRQILEAANN